MRRSGRILTLTTDFGTADGYVGAVKGRILSMVPEAHVVDNSHDIPPQDIGRGAWCLRRAVPQYPDGTVHLAVIDPGVGSARSGVVIETEHHLLVGPDNGLLFLAARDDGIRRIVEIGEDTRDWYKSTTFDGLTLFAPIAALLLQGMPLDDVGPDAEDLVEWPDATVRRHGNVIEGKVAVFDAFGNAITDIPGEALRGVEVQHIYLRNSEDVRLCDHYAELAGSRHPGAIVNSDGRLEVAIYGESVRERLGLHIGDAIRVLLRPA